MLYVNGLYKKYGKEVILDHVSFQVEQGEMFSLIGPIGAGKTTLINILTGLTNPNEGQAFINGIDCCTQKKQARALYGYIPENLKLYPKYKVKEYLNFFTEINNMEDSENLIVNLMEFTGLINRKDSYIRDITAGEKLKLSIARALLHNPKVLLLDNPFLGLELEEIYEIKGILDYLRGTGRTVFLTSENLKISISISSSVGILDEGKMLSGDQVARIYEKVLEKAKGDLKTQKEQE